MGNAPAGRGVTASSDRLRHDCLMKGRPPCTWRPLTKPMRGTTSPEALTIRRRDGVERPAARPKLSWPGVHGCSHRLQTCRRVVVSITVALFGNNHYFFCFCNALGCANERIAKGSVPLVSLLTFWYTDVSRVKAYSQSAQGLRPWRGAVRRSTRCRDRRLCAANTVPDCSTSDIRSHRLTPPRTAA